MVSLLSHLENSHNLCCHAAAAGVKLNLHKIVMAKIERNEQNKKKQSLEEIVFICFKCVWKGWEFKKSQKLAETCYKI